MRRNCNLELRLLPSSGDRHNMVEESSESRENQQQQQQQQQQLTIFYNGRVCVSDVTELQARTILMLANTEMDESLRTPTSGSEPASPSTVLSTCMKRSLQRFLQKRKNRIQATSPYH